MLALKSGEEEKIQAFILNPSSPIWNFRDLTEVSFLWDILDMYLFMATDNQSTYKTHMEVNRRKTYIVYTTLGTNMWLV